MEENNNSEKFKAIPVTGSASYNQSTKNKSGDRKSVV